jgi:hypothetical protein
LGVIKNMNAKYKLIESLKSNRGQGGVSKAIGITFMILIVAVLAPMIFGSDGLANTDLVADAPGWVVLLLTLGAGIALVRLVISNK